MNGKWHRTSIWISWNEENPFSHVYMTSEASDNETGLKAVTDATEWIARDRECHFRVMPEAESEKDFDTKLTRHRGFSRFSFAADKSGPRHKPPTHEEMDRQELAGFGLATSK